MGRARGWLFCTRPGGAALRNGETPQRRPLLQGQLVCVLPLGQTTGTQEYTSFSYTPRTQCCRCCAESLSRLLWRQAGPGAERERVLLVAACKASQVVLVVRNLPVSAGDIRDEGSIPQSGRSPGGGSGNHPSVLALRIPWTEEPGGLQSIGSQRMVHDRSNLGWTEGHQNDGLHSLSQLCLKSRKLFLL